MRRLKGAVILGRLAYLDQEVPAAAREQIMAALAASHRTQLERRILPGDWYPFELYLDLVGALVRIVGGGDPSFARQLGRYAARAQLASSYQAFVRPGEPAFAMRMAPQIWSHFHDFGRLEAGIEGPTEARLTLHDTAGAGRLLCEGVSGWAATNLEIAGARGVVIEHLRCLEAGEDCCDMRLTWQ